MRSLLRFFPAYAALEMKCAAQAEQIALLEDNRVVAEARCDDIRRVADAAWLAATGRSIFGLVSERLPLPADYVQPEPTYSAPRTTKSVQAEAAANAAGNLEKFFDDALAN